MLPETVCRHPNRTVSKRNNVMTQKNSTDVSRHADAQLSAKAWWIFVAVAASSVLWHVDSAQAEHADINLKIISPDKTVSATSDRTPPVGGLIRRPVIVVKAGDPLIFQYFLTNIYPHGVLKNVVVRYYIIRIEKVGQKAVPKLPSQSGVPASNKRPLDSAVDHRVVTQGQVTMNFKPRCRVGARVLFRIKQPGVYLVRVESANTQSDHEHFSAIDLQVK